VILAGDVGGTKTNIALFRERGAVPERVRAAKYKSADHGGLEDIISDFLKSGERPEAACFGVAGPVIVNRSETPNLPWVIDGARIAARFGIAKVVLLNDLVATAIRGATLGPDEVAGLNGRLDAVATGTRLVVAAGTGLGLAAVVRLGPAWVTVPSEGGHTDLPSQNEEQAALVAYLAGRLGHVSVERAVSGRGLLAIWKFVVETGRAVPTPEVARAVEESPESAPRLISEHGIAGTCPASVQALGLFVELYGAASGNFALTFMSTGGVLLGGGIAPKILPALKDGRFMRAFTDKGRFREMLERTPVAVILDQDTALLGAAIRAAEELALP